ncbi:MAG: tyrosine-type recombinase/integrase, partial [Gemmatimonadales bacterium]
MSATAVRLQVDRDFWLESFRDFLALESGHSANTVEAYLRDLRRMGEFATSRGVRDPARLTRVLLREFVFLLKDLGLSPSSIRRSVSAIRTYYGFLLGEGRVKDDPSDRLESPRRGRVLPETLSVPEVEALLGSPKVEQPLAWRDRSLLELAYGAGLRVSELCSLGLTDLLLTENLIRVFGKGSKERLVPIGRSVIGAVSVYLHTMRPELDRGKSKGRVLLNARGEPLSRVGAWGVVKRAAERAGIAKRVTPHTLRHS